MEDLDGFADAYFTHTLSKTYHSMFPRASFSKTTLKKVGTENEQQDFIRGLKQISPENVNLVYTSYDQTCNDLEGEARGYVEKISSYIQSAFNKCGFKQKNIDRELTKIKKKPKNVEALITGITSNFYHNERILTQAKVSKEYGKSRKDAFNNVYISNARKTITEHDESTFPKVKCRFCKTNTVNKLTKYSFFSERNFKPTGTSIETFSNNFYFLQSDLVMCDLCQLILFCSWAGFNNIPWSLRKGKKDAEYLFVTIPSIYRTFYENERVANEFAKSQIDSRQMIYESIMTNLFIGRPQMKSIWALQNTLFIEIKPETQKNRAIPHVFVYDIGKDVAEMFAKDPISVNALKNLNGKFKLSASTANLKTEDSWINIKREVVVRLLNNESLHPISETLLKDHIEQPKPASGSMTALKNICLISSVRSNTRFKIQGGYVMDSRKTYGIIEGYAQCGRNLASGIDIKRRRQLSYRLLSTIRTGCVDGFYDGIVKLYVDQGVLIPQHLIGLLNRHDTIQFEDKAYALMSGFLGEKSEKNSGEIKGVE